MRNPPPAIKEIQHLITANFERMVAFEQAAFNAGTAQLKQYFEEKANDSEKNILELNSILHSLDESSFDVESEGSQNLLGTTMLFTGQKNMNAILKHVLYLEKSIIKWYKRVMSSLKGLSHHATQVLSKQYTEVQASHVYVQNC